MARQLRYGRPEARYYFRRNVRRVKKTDGLLQQEERRLERIDAFFPLAGLQAHKTCFWPEAMPLQQFPPMVQF